MSADSSSLMPMWSWAILRKPLNHWSRGSSSGRLECHSSGWIPDLTRCEAIEGFRILSGVSECLEHEDQSSLNFSLVSRIYGLILVLGAVRACDIGLFPSHRRYGIRKIVWSLLEFCC